jgi:hypothetical protein
MAGLTDQPAYPWLWPRAEPVILIGTSVRPSPTGNRPDQFCWGDYEFQFSSHHCGGLCARRCHSDDGPTDTILVRCGERAVLPADVRRFFGGRVADAINPANRKQ